MGAILKQKERGLRAFIRRVIPQYRGYAVIFLIPIFLSAAWLPSAAANAAYVLYFHVFGSWAVVCSMDEASKRRWCSLSAPPPVMESAGVNSLISVAYTADGGITVDLRLAGAIAPDQPAFIRIDGNLEHRVQPNRVGEASWSGDEATAIVEEFKRGKTVSLRSFSAWTGAPRVESISLDSFAQALSTYGEKRRVHGVGPGG